MEPEDIDDDAPSRSALRIVDCHGERGHSDSEREGSADGRAESDSEREDSDDDREDSGGTHAGSHDNREDLDGLRMDSDEEREDSNDEREGSDSGGEAPEGAIDIGSDVETSELESGSDEDGESRDLDEDSDGVSDGDGDAPVDNVRTYGLCANMNMLFRLACPPSSHKRYLLGNAPGLKFSTVSAGRAALTYKNPSCPPDGF